MSTVAENIYRVRERVWAAAKRAGRSPEHITVVAVTKLVDVVLVEEAAAAGIVHFGENRVQEAAAKIPQLVLGVRGRSCWHMIGPLQSNKVKKAAELFDRVDSLCRWDIIQMLDSRCQALNRDLEVLLEIKLSDEPAKSGVLPQDLNNLLARWDGVQRLKLRGLMTIAPLTQDPQAVRKVFERLRNIQDAVNVREFLSRPLDVLSMGMSGDFEIAVEEGATELRIGSALFGERRTE